MMGMVMILMLVMVMLIVDSDGGKQGLQNVDCAFQREDKYFQNVVNQIAHKRNLCILGRLVFCKKK